MYPVIPSPLTQVPTVIVGPAQPPMEVDYARRHIKSLGISDDVLIAHWIQAAASYFEEQTGRPIITRTYELWLNGFPGCSGRIELPNPPLQSVESIVYRDDAGADATFDDDNYRVSTPAGPYARRGWIELANGSEWPSTASTSTTSLTAVKVQYVAGYGDAPSDVPALITGILCFLVGHFDQYRSAAVDQQRGNVVPLPMGVDQMLAGFKYSARQSLQMRGTW